MRASWALVTGGRAGGKFVGHLSSFSIFDDFWKLVGRILLDTAVTARLLLAVTAVTADTAPTSFEGPAAPHMVPSTQESA